MAIFKGDEKKFEDKIDVCHKPKKSDELTVVGLAFFSVPTICPIVANYASIYYFN